MRPRRKKKKWSGFGLRSSGCREKNQRTIGEVLEIFEEREAGGVQLGGSAKESGNLF